jgi:hypothetical protein
MAIAKYVIPSPEKSEALFTMPEGGASVSVKLMEVEDTVVLETRLLPMTVEVTQREGVREGVGRGGGVMLSFISYLDDNLRNNLL